MACLLFGKVNLLFYGTMHNIFLEFLFVVIIHFMQTEPCTGPLAALSIGLLGLGSFKLSFINQLDKQQPDECHFKKTGGSNILH